MRQRKLKLKCEILGTTKYLLQMCARVYVYIVTGYLHNYFKAELFIFNIYLICCMYFILDIRCLYLYKVNNGGMKAKTI